MSVDVLLCYMLCPAVTPWMWWWRWRKSPLKYQIRAAPPSLQIDLSLYMSRYDISCVYIYIWFCLTTRDPHQSFRSNRPFCRLWMGHLIFWDTLIRHTYFRYQYCIVMFILDKTLRASHPKFFFLIFFRRWWMVVNKNTIFPQNYGFYILVEPISLYINIIYIYQYIYIYK